MTLPPAGNVCIIPSLRGHPSRVAPGSLKLTSDMNKDLWIHDLWKFLCDWVPHETQTNQVVFIGEWENSQHSPTSSRNYQVVRPWAATPWYRGAIACILAPFARIGESNRPHDFSLKGRGCRDCCWCWCCCCWVVEAAKSSGTQNEGTVPLKLVSFKVGWGFPFIGGIHIACAFVPEFFGDWNTTYISR